MATMPTRDKQKTLLTTLQTLTRPLGIGETRAALAVRCIAVIDKKNVTPESVLI
jgi:hypothetical protein